MKTSTQIVEIVLRGLKLDWKKTRLGLWFANVGGVVLRVSYNSRLGKHDFYLHHEFTSKNYFSDYKF